jgi:hypothetical protein
MYQPTFAGWVSADPIGFYDGINKFAYVSNSPVGGIDPSGTEVCKICEFTLENQLHVIEYQFKRFAKYRDSNGEEKTCPIPKFECCPRNDLQRIYRDAFDPCKYCNSTAGNTIPPETPHGEVRIGICPQTGEQDTYKFYESLIKHELEHAISWCRRGWTRAEVPSCKELLCEEIYARVRAGQCPSKNYPNRLKCLVAGALKSVEGSKSCEGVSRIVAESYANHLVTLGYCHTGANPDGREDYPYPNP